MERAGTTGVDAAVPMVESSGRLAYDGEDDDDDKSWYDTYNMTGDDEKKKKKKEAKERERGKRYTYRYCTLLFDQLIRQTVRQSAVQIVMPYIPYLTLPCLYLPYLLLSACHYEVLPTISIIKVTVWFFRYFIFPTCTCKVPSQKKLWPPHR